MNYATGHPNLNHQNKFGTVVEDIRQQQLNDWLAGVFKAVDFKLTTASADASFRRYFRVHLTQEYLGKHTLIAMDAPPPQENCRPFVEVAALFGKSGLNVPTVLAQDLERGFLLLTDLGDVTYLSQLNNQSAGALYQDANQALITLQLASQSGVLPNYDE